MLLASRGGPLRGRAVGLVCNPTAVDARLRHAADLLHALPGVRLRALFGPEHGVRGDAQYMAAVGGERDPRTGLPVHSLYGATAASLAPGPAQLRGLDVLCFDIQDVGSRYYTYQATMMLCMEAAARAGLPWVFPSPNMPTPETALVYPGMCLLEGTNLSEGRGTTRPFELFGAPWLDAARLASDLAAERLPGVAFRPASFVPTWDKHAGVRCHGVDLHVHDPEAFRPFLTGVACVLHARAQAPRAFRWRTEPYEFVADVPAFDLLCGSARERLGIAAGRPLAELAAAWRPEARAFARRRRPYLCYPA